MIVLSNVASIGADLLCWSLEKGLKAS